MHRDLFVKHEKDKRSIEHIYHKAADMVCWKKVHEDNGLMYWKGAEKKDKFWLNDSN